MSYPDPIAYTEADYHCPDCAEARFGRCPDDGFIACPDDPLGTAHFTDFEGNPVGVVAP